MLLGIALVMVAAVCIGLGLFLQKRGLAKGLRAALRSPVWLTGIAVDAAGFGLYILALNFERIAIVQPLMSLSLLVTAVAEMALLGESMSKYELVAFVMFFVGIALMV